MSERWKPEKNDLYFFVSSAGDIIPDRADDDFASYKGRFGFGNYFRSRSEAEAAAEKVKKLLLSLQDNGDPLQDKQLPEWVEIGGYVYDDRNGYGKIVRGSVKSCYIEFDGGAGEFAAEDFVEFKQARLRPYNDEEMKALVGDVFEDKNGNLYLAVSYIPHGRGLLIGGFYFNAEELLNTNFTIDGKPAGVLEHRNDAGE